MSFATWNPSDKSANITLSGGNLTAASTAAGTAVRSTVSVSTGKWYWEIHIDSGAGDNLPGVGDSSAATNNPPGQDAHGYGYFENNGNKYHSASLTAYGASFATGDTIGVALDAGGGTVTFYKNNVSQGSITLAGVSAPYYAMWGSGGSVIQCTANFGATAQTYSPPSGYTAGLSSSNAWSQTCSEAITNTDKLLRTTTRVLSEAISNTDTLIRITTRALIEAITNTDTLIKTTTRAFVESITNSDTLSALRTKPLNASEAIALADTFLRSITHVLTEAITNTDALIRTTGRAFMDAITASDSVAKTPGKLLAETLSVADQLARSVTHILSETATVTATFFKITGRSLAESVASSDTFSHTWTVVRTFSETMGVSDALTKLLNGTSTIWTNAQKAITSFVNASKAATTWINRPRT